MSKASEYYMPMELLPPKENWAANSTHRLSRIEMQKAMTKIKRFVERRLETDLNLFEHAAPIAFVSGTGVNDELDGSDSKAPVKFVVPNQYIPRGIKPKPASALTPEERQQAVRYKLDCEVMQSLAKWKRIMLDRLGVEVGDGIYCSSTSIRKGYKGDVTHSVIADQWDYEIRIRQEDRNLDTLKSYVNKIWKIITDAEDYILEEYPQILLPGHPTSSIRLPKEIQFITAEELHAKYPNEDVHGRENAAVREYGAIFIIGMGWPIAGGPPEEVRAPAYDDWNLNGDIMVMHPLTGYRHELSSMGIRVDSKSIVAQLKHRGFENQIDLPFNQSVIHNRLPFSYGGGIGISRLLMLLLRCAHIGEVQCGIWHDEHYKQVCGAPGVDMIPDRIVKWAASA
jgi:aspartate--ammonia ligase